MKAVAPILGGVIGATAGFFLSYVIFVTMLEWGANLFVLVLMAAQTDVTECRAWTSPSIATATTPIWTPPPSCRCGAAERRLRVRHNPASSRSSGGKRPSKNAPR